MSKKKPSGSDGKIIVFGAKQIRRIWLEEQWFFSVVDIIGALTESNAPSKYWTAMKRREEEASGFQLSTICRQLKMTASDGKNYTTEAVNTEGAFRIIQSIPSPKAEPSGLRKRPPCLKPIRTTTRNNNAIIDARPRNERGENWYSDTRAKPGTAVVKSYRGILFDDGVPEKKWNGSESVTKCDRLKLKAAAWRRTLSPGGAEYL